MNSIVIQRISLDDPLYQLERELRNRVLLRPIGVPDYGWEMHDRKSWHFVTLDGENVVGCVVLVPLDDTNRKTQLIQMAVARSFQGQGIGTRLINELIKFAKLQGIEEITCHARENAVPFYLKLQFEVYGEPFQEVGILHRHMRRYI